MVHLAPLFFESVELPLGIVVLLPPVPLVALFEAGNGAVVDELLDDTVVDDDGALAATPTTFTGACPGNSDVIGIGR